MERVSGADALGPLGASTAIDRDPDFADQWRDISARPGRDSLRCDLPTYKEGFFTADQLESLSQTTAERLEARQFVPSATPKEMLTDAYAKRELARVAGAPEAFDLSPGEAGPTVVVTALVLFKLARAWGAASGRIAVPTSNQQARRAIYRHMVEDPAAPGSKIAFGALTYRRNRRSAASHEARIAPEQTYRRARKLLERIGYVFAAVAHESGPDRCIAVILPEMPTGAALRPEIDLAPNALERCLSPGQQIRLNTDKRQLATPHVNKLKAPSHFARRPSHNSRRRSSGAIERRSKHELQQFSAILERSLVREGPEISPLVKLFLGRGQQIDVRWLLPDGPITVDAVRSWATSQFVFSAGSLTDVQLSMLELAGINSARPDRDWCSPFYDVGYLFNAGTQGHALQRDINVLCALSSRRSAMDKIMEHLVKTANRSDSAHDFLPHSFAFLMPKIRAEILRLASAAAPVHAAPVLEASTPLDHRQRDRFRSALRRSTAAEITEANLTALSLTGQSDVLLIAGDFGAWRLLSNSDSEWSALQSAAKSIGARTFYFAGPRNIPASVNLARSRRVNDQAKAQPTA